MAFGAPVTLRETFGLDPLRPALADARRAIAGSPHVPPSRWGLSSLRIFKPGITFPTWLRRRRPDGKVPIYNFVNRVPQPQDEGYSVRCTYARDFRGGRFTYDGHLGTDFACPVGTPVVAAAPGVVLRVCNELDRGGLKVCIDHGDGLFTTSNHLSRALVEPGARVRRGDTVGLSGASGLELVLFFPWVAPHLHYNVFLNGRPVDPFAREDETSLWRHRNDPVPFDGTEPPEDADFTPSPWDEAGVNAAVAACRDPDLRARMAALPLDRRAADVLVNRLYRPTLFEAFPPLHAETFRARPRLDLPFRAEDYTGAAFPD